MKMNQTFVGTKPPIIAALLVAAVLLCCGMPTRLFAADPPVPSPAPASPAPGEKPLTPTPGAPLEPVTPPETPPSAEETPGPTTEVSTNGLLLNFRGVSLDTVLDYLSDAAGFIIVKETRVKGTVELFSKQPVSRDEAVNLLNTVLNKNGYAAIRNDRTLTIVNRDEAKIHDVRVVQGSDPKAIPRNDEIVTQILPVRSVEVAQLVKDLQPLLSAQTTMTANEAGNSLVITDTQANIHRIAEIIQAIDKGAEDVTVIRVFRLRNADPAEMADLLTSLFPDDTRSGTGGGGQAPIQFGRFGGLGGFGGFGGRGGGGGGGAGGANANAQNQRLKKRNRVVAVADPRTASLIVTATRDLIGEIESVVAELDESSKGRQVVRVYDLQNASPQEALPVLQDMFMQNKTQNSRTSSQTDPLQSRSTTQSQQNNTTSRTGNSGGRGGGTGGIGGSFQ